MTPDFRADNAYQTLLVKALELQGVKIEFGRYYQRFLSIFRTVLEKKDSFDVVHLHWIHPYIQEEQKSKKFFVSLKFLLDILMTRMTGVRIVWTVHNMLSHDVKFPYLELWTRRVLSKLVNQIIIHNSSTLESVTREYNFNPTKAAVIANGHYREVYNPLVNQIEARKELGLPLEGRIYLNQGLLRPYKGVERLLKIWRDNKALFEKDTLLIAGKPLDEEYNTKLAQLSAQVPGVVLYPKFVEDTKINLFFSAADVVVLPFEKILNSSSVILAMSYGKPVIAPRLGGIAETLGSADSLLYNPNDEQGLIQAMQKSTLIDLNQLSKLVVESCDKLDWKKIAEKTLETYQGKK